MTDPFDFAERAAIPEHEGRFLRDTAERMALDEIIDSRLAEPLAGILAELSAAARHRRRPEVEIALGLLGKRRPAWGVARILPDGRTYRPAPPDEPGRPAIIVPATVDGTVVDLVAEDMATGLLHTRLDIAAVIGVDEIDLARRAGRPLIAFASASSWLGRGSRGIVVINWRHIGEAVDGVPAILTPTHLARRMYDATARCLSLRARRSAARVTTSAPPPRCRPTSGRPDERQFRPGGRASVGWRRHSRVATQD